MKKSFALCLLMILTGIQPLLSQNLPLFPKVTPAGKRFVDTRVDAMTYWKRMALLGYVETNPYIITEDPIFTGSMIAGNRITPQDSPDVPTTNESGTTQSENSIFVDPVSNEIVLNSNNSTDWSGASIGQLYGCDYLFTTDASATWGGSIFGAGGSNSGDPTTAIGRNGWWYVGKISNPWGQNVAYSTDQGQTWTDVEAGPPPGGFDLLDKNHMWIDNSPDSPYEGNLYNAWTPFLSSGSGDGQIEVVRSTDKGLSWLPGTIVSFGVNAGIFNHGVNINTGPDGEVYLVWAIYDSWPSDETALGFARSFDGGASYDPSVRIVNNIRGIRTTATGKNMRVNSFPTMAVDNSNGPNRGIIYVTWANIGTPGINTGTDIDVYMIKSSDQGTTWSTPVKVNQDPPGLGKQHYFPWITCDPVTGNLAVVYYDDRQTTTSKAETWISYSYDGGESWDDIKVSDVAFTPAPIPGLAASYFGDYIGITSNNMMVYPVWTDNRDGRALSYVSPISLGPPPNQPYVSYYDHEFTSIRLKGKGNLNYGDSVYVTIELKNIGDQPASNLVAQLSSDSPYILITDDSEDYGTMAPGEIKSVTNGYALKVSDSIPDNLKIKFTVNVSDSDTTWLSQFTATAGAPGLVIAGRSINDAIGGNNNGRLDPGESAEITFTISNTGDFACPATYTLFSSPSEILIIGNDSLFLDELQPGQTKTATFPVTVDEEASLGMAATLVCHAQSGLYDADAVYQESIGMFVEDWETNSFTKFPWQFGGNKQWTINNTIPYEGSYCSESGWIYDNQSTILNITYTSSVDDSISFYKKVSTEAGWDFLYFRIDGVLMGSWSGEEDWSRSAYPVSAGTHVFQWEYVKDVYLSSGDDRTWIDFIEFPPPILPVVNAGADDTLCGISIYQLQGSASLYDSLLWTTKGDGVFDTATILDPIYTAGPGDLLAGNVKLSLKGFGQNGLNINSMFLVFGTIPNASITIDPKDTLCAWQSATLIADTTGVASYLWTPGGLTTQEITVDTAFTGGLGTSLIILETTSEHGCKASDSTYITFRDCTAIDEPLNTFWWKISPNPGNGLFVLEINSPSQETISLRMVNSRNSEVYRNEVMVSQGRSTVMIDLSSYAAGVYLLTVEREKIRETRKLVIVR